MYIPEHFVQKDENIIFEFIARYNFGILISKGKDELKATHLPFIAEKTKKGKILLSSHMAKANPQWQDFSDEEVLVIFHGPHAYISPIHYTSPINVPTWNYVAAHAYGKAHTLNEDQIYPLMEKMILQHDPAYLKQWNKLPENYRSGLAKGVMAFEIKINRLEGKEKLSQNKSEQEKCNIINELKSSCDSNISAIAEFMKEKLLP